MKVPLGQEEQACQQKEESVKPVQVLQECGYWQNVQEVPDSERKTKAEHARGM